jgi:hypothetical protein
MDRDELMEQTMLLIKRSQNTLELSGAYAEICEFLRNYAGPTSAFLETAKQYNPSHLAKDYARGNLLSVLKSFHDYLKAGLDVGISPERRAQLDVVSDYLSMAQTLLDDKSVHPAAPAVLIGATLEEFLRNWCEAEGLDLANRKPGLETYSQILRDANLLTKQDGKDITSWAGIRNHAAHGEWNEVEDRKRVQLMMEGINLFMRKHTP